MSTENQEIKIREASGREVNAIENLNHDEALRGTTVFRSKMDIQRNLNNFIVAVVDKEFKIQERVLKRGQVLGYGAINEETGDMEIAVSPEHRRRGVGTMLVEGIVDRARAWGLSGLTTSIVPDLHKFIEDCGFKRAPRLYGDLTGRIDFCYQLATQPVTVDQMMT